MKTVHIINILKDIREKFVNFSFKLLVCHGTLLDLLLLLHILSAIV